MLELTHEYGFVVIGGGLAGIAAAVTAARAGLHVALVQDRPVLGGCASTEVRIPPAGATNCNFTYCRETGLIEEIYLENLYRNPTWSEQGWEIVLNQVIKEEKRLDCFLNTSIDAVTIDASGNTIAAVAGWTRGSETRRSFRAPLFADCTGDGTIGALAGAPFRMGAEAGSEFGESLANEKTERRVMGSTVQMAARDAGRPMPFLKPDWVDIVVDEDDIGPYRDACRSFLEHKRGFWWLEWGGELDTVHDSEQIRKTLLKILYAVWDYMKNRSPIADQLCTYELDWVGAVPGKRESRRLEGDYILSQVDIESQQHFDDAVAYGGWGFDDHPSRGFFGPIPSYHVYHGGPYNIPLRCLHSRKVLNLLMAGRDISVTHVALTSVRVMLTCSQMGEAIGTAAAACVEHDILPHQLVHEPHMNKVQLALQRADHHIHALPYIDPADLAPRAQVNASSTLASPRLDESVGLVPLDQDRLWQFPVCTPSLDSTSLLLDVNQNTRLTATLYQGPPNGSTYPAVPLATQRVDLSTGVRQWVELDWAQSTEPGWYFCEIEANPNVHVHCGEHPPVGISSYVVRPQDPNRPNPFSRWNDYQRSKLDRPSYCFRVRPDQPVYCPDNVTNPWSRPTTLPNLWISETTDFREPEWIELVWPSPQIVQRVDLLFDSSLDFAFLRYLPYQGWEGYTQNTIPSLVSEYRLCHLTETGDWRTCAYIEGNYQRHRTHCLENIYTRAIKLEIMGTNGINRAQVYSIRAYGPL